MPIPLNIQNTPSPSRRRVRFSCFLFVGRAVVLRAHDDGKVEDGLVHAENAQRHMRHPLGAEDQRRAGDPVRLAVQRDLQLRVQIIRISRVAAEKADQLIILVYMFIKDGVTLRHGKVPGRVHLERTGTDIVVDPQDALGEFSVDLLKFRRAGVRLGQLLDDEPAGPSLVVLKHIIP